MPKANKADILIIAVLVIAAVFLRFYSLGYSNYTADEYGAMVWTKDTPDNFPRDLKDFFLTRKKGPVQYLISYIPIFFSGEYNNELALRIPFAVFSVMAVVVFYLLVRRLTKSTLVGFISAVLLMTSGFIAAYGRIAQYQNLNLFFSFSALYLFSELLVSKDNLLRKTMLGTTSLALSVLSHWDAIFVIFPLILIVGQFVRSKTFSKKFKAKILTVNLLLGLTLTLPFLIPYFARFVVIADSREYVNRRLGYSLESNSESYIFDIGFYNPFVTLWLYAIGGIVGALFIKRSRFFVGWFLVNFAFFEFFVMRPGTHIYNFLVPLFVLVAIALSQLIEKSFKYLKAGPVIFVSLLLAFLYYQTYLVFVDHSVEYPWRQEEILGHSTEKRSHENRSRYLIGFPHNRFWEEINEYVLEQNKINGETFGYMSNESKTISEYYMEAKYKTSEGFYAVGIKNPWSFSNDFRFPQIKDKHTVKKINNDLGISVVRIYRVDN